MSMLYARCKHSRLDVSASALCGEGVITGDFECLSCGKPVTLVRSTYAVQHFRHASGESCIVSARESAEQMDVAKARVENRMSVFHTTWQSRFPEECREYRRPKVTVHDDDTITKIWHVADVKLSGGPFEDVFIEIQHSQIAQSDIVSRELTYTYDRSLLCWIFDCTDIKFKLEDTKINSRISTDMILSPTSPPLHSGIKALILAHQERTVRGAPCIYIDTGHTEIYAVVDPFCCKLNRQRLSVARVNRARFLQGLAKEFPVEVAPWPHDTPPSPTGPVLDWDAVGVKVPRGVEVKHTGVNIKMFTPFAQWKIYARRMIERYIVGTAPFGKYKNLNCGVQTTLKQLALIEQVLSMPDNKPPDEAFHLLRDMPRWSALSYSTPYKIVDFTLTI